MKKNIKKFIIILNLLLIALPLNLLSAWSTFDKAKAENNDSDPADITENIVPENSDYDGPDDDFADSSGVQVTKMPESVISITNFFDNNYTTNDQYEMSQSGFLWAVENIASDPKLILNPSDLQDIRTLYCLGSVVPDFANHDDALAAASGKTLSQIANLKASNLKDYQALVIQAQESAKKDIVSDLKNDLPNFACIAGVNQNQAADMLKYDPDSVKAIIDNAQNKVVIDRRILELLVNLVTPKNQGGAGHELIKVQRIRNGYNRDAKQNSRESDAIYQQIAEANSVGKSTLNTVGDIASANKDALSNDPTIAGAAGQAEVLDSTGASQGDLIFSDQETASNLSAHYKGEAVDIAAVDNIKCTLIKKKYIGSDTKRKLPATPISLAWQTSSGYDNSPPPDYSSLDANLRQLASGNYLDLIDQLGISVDSSEDLSDSSFSDIVSLIGQSLLGEMLNSPNMAISGTTFADTIKKIGGMALADHLNLPRQAFVDANLADLNDLESKIGEAQIEQKMNLPWGSLRGNNMNDIFTNAGERHVENALHLPENTLNTSITDQNGFLLTVGRRTIEQALSLPASIFDSSTNFSKLEQLGGKRKVDLVYQNPTSVDERLGLGLGDYSRNYKSGSLS
ncbi:hypothetical protein COT12_03110, partial [Candidatus Berkelbacteria bacterium CG08_land_8_20_14_0_20_39_8]